MPGHVRVLYRVLRGRLQDPRDIPFTIFWQERRHEVERALRGKLGSSNLPAAELDDFIAEAWLRLMLHMRDGKPLESPKRFLFRCVLNARTDHFRRKTRHRRRDEAFKTHVEIFSGDDGECERELSAILGRALTQISKEDRDLVVIGEKNLPPNLRQRKSRAVRRLREIVGQIQRSDEHEI